MGRGVWVPAFAGTTKHCKQTFTFSRHDLPEFCKYLFALPKSRGRRECRMRAAPEVSCASWVESARMSIQGSGGNPTFPAQGSYEKQIHKLNQCRVVDVFTVVSRFRALVAVKHINSCEVQWSDDIHQKVAPTYSQGEDSPMITVTTVAEPGQLNVESPLYWIKSHAPFLTTF